MDEDLELLRLQALARQRQAAAQQTQPLNLRRQEGETPEAYRARIEAARAATAGQDIRSPGAREMDAQAMQAMATPPLRERVAETVLDNVVGLDNGRMSVGEGIGAWLNRAGEASTFGLVGDEVNALAYGMLPGRTTEGELQRFRQNEEDLGWAGRLSADIFGGALPAVLGIGALGSLPSLGGRVAAGIGGGIAAGGTQGFMEGEGGFQNRAVNALLGAGFGGIVGGAVPIAAEFGRAGVRAVSDALRNRRIGQAVGQPLGVSPEAARMVAQIVGAEDQDVLREAFERAGPNAMLADGSGALGQALDASLQSPVPGTVLARERIADRAGQAYFGLMDSLYPQQGPQLPPGAAMQAIRTQAGEVLDPLYRAAYDTPIPYGVDIGAGNLIGDGAADTATEAAQRLLGLQPRLPAQAINYANQLMRLRGEQSGQIMASIADDGTVAFTRLPDVRQWDYIKQALDFLAESGDGAGALGGQTRLGAAYQTLAREIRDNLAGAVPAYGDAVSTAADAITTRQAVQFGTELLSPRVTTEEALAQIADATPPQLRAMQDGVRGQIAEAIGNVRAAAADQNMDARQALAALRMFTSDNAKRRLGMLFGDQWDAIRTQLDEAGAAVGLRARTATGSQTAGRQFFNEMLTNETTPGPLQRGRPLEAVQNIVGGMTGASPEAIRAAQAAVRSQIADLLTRPGITGQALPLINNALAANPYNFGAGGNTALSLGLGGYTLGFPAMNNALLAQ